MSVRIRSYLVFPSIQCACQAKTFQNLSMSKGSIGLALILLRGIGSCEDIPLRRVGPRLDADE